MRLYRVLPYLPRASRGRPGHPLHVPAASGAGRIDNPGRYDALYLGDSPAGAVAEAFGWAARWGAGLLRGVPTLPGSVRALATYDLADGPAVCDLDDAHRLVQLSLRPSDVVSRDRARTQGWAARIYADAEYAGVRWWSYYDPRWGSFGLWDITGIRVAGVAPLALDHPAVTEAADVLLRPVSPGA